VELVGYTPPPGEAAHHAGDTLPLILLWLARRTSQEDLRSAVLLEGDEERVLAESAVGGAYPSTRWAAGDAVRQALALRLPDDLPAGSYRLKLRLTRDGQPVPWDRGLLPLGSDLDLGTVKVGKE
jgi:hypothetical protein